MRILIIEDERKIANAIKKGLEQEAFSVDIAYNGNDGYDLATTEEYDAIILDRMLPQTDGLEICKKLRQNNMHTPILMLTAKSELEDKVSGLNAGADDYLTKPFAFEELLARIRALLRRPENSMQNILTCNDLALDTLTYNVERTGKQINLTKKEFALLEYLMRNKNKILTKEQIIAHIWDYDADVLPNTVEQYIKYIRTKIGKDLVKTVRGFGYVLKEDKNV